MAAAIVAGAGTQSNLSLELIRMLEASGRAVHVVSRGQDKADALQERLGLESNARFYVADLGDAESMAKVAAGIEGPVDVLIHNAARLVVGDFEELSLEQFEDSWRSNIGSAIPIAQCVLPLMVARSKGTVIFSGATASVRGGARFSAFASAKFALRGLAQSLARAYGPKGVHIAHVIVDGIMWGDRAEQAWGKKQDECMDPQAVAAAYRSLIEQPASAWTHEMDLRRAEESF